MNSSDLNDSPRRSLAASMNSGLLMICSTSAREHVDEAHPEMQFSDEQLRTMIAEQAYDK